MQQQIIFHNNAESASHYQKHKNHFSKQCVTVLDALKRGERLTTLTALVNYGIGDLRRRIKDLKDLHGIPVKCEFVDNTRFKVYYL